MITSDIQKSSTSNIVELFVLDLLPIGINEQYYFHNGVNELNGNVYWQGQLYTRFPIEAEGFQKVGNGQQPRPVLRLANIEGLVGQLANANGDLVKAKLTRKRTFMKYLDDENFSGGNPTADANVHFEDEVWFIDRKVRVDKIFVEFELASVFDLEGVQLPKRQCIQNVCTWKYRSAECSYAGDPVATRADVGTNDPALDDCGKRLSSCKLRFSGELPFGGFISISLIR